MFCRDFRGQFACDGLIDRLCKMVIRIRQGVPYLTKYWLICIECFFDRDKFDLTVGRNPVVSTFLISKHEQIIMEKLTSQQRSQLFEICFPNQCSIDPLFYLEILFNVDTDF